MWVHSQCLQREIDASTSCVCSTCRAEYRTKLNVQFDRTMCIWLAMLAILLLDEAIIIATTRMPLGVGLWFLVVDVVYGFYLSRYMQAERRIVLVRST